MTRVRLIHWKAAEAEAGIKKLEQAGYDVDYAALDGAEVLRAIRQGPPDAIVIDLSRLPSHGREVAIALRQAKATRVIPLVFCEGVAEKVERLQALLPDAIYTSWSRIRSSLKRAIARSSQAPIVPPSHMESYSGTPLPKKLGIKPGSIVVLVDSPADFEQTLGTLPSGVVLRKQARAKGDLTIWFTKSRRDLERRVELLGQRAGKDGLWIAWPKKTSSVKTDLTQAIVRQTGLDSGLVDYKICAIDATWSGLRFTRRKK